MASISLRTRAHETIAGVRISDAYQALTGVKPRRTGSDTWRAPAIWRDGEGLNDYRLKPVDSTYGHRRSAMDQTVVARRATWRLGKREYLEAPGYWPW
jgi:hypothetical protein